MVAASGVPATTPLPAKAAAPAEFIWLRVTHALGAVGAAGADMVEAVATVGLITMAAATAVDANFIQMERMVRLRFPPPSLNAAALEGEVPHRKWGTTRRRN
jgi:hypothetical protein